MEYSLISPSKKFLRITLHSYSILAQRHNMTRTPIWLTRIIPQRPSFLEEHIAASDRKPTENINAVCTKQGGNRWPRQYRSHSMWNEELSKPSSMPYISDTDRPVRRILTIEVLKPLEVSLPSLLRIVFWHHICCGQLALLIDRSSNASSKESLNKII